jgi:hypothetical protein
VFAIKQWALQKLLNTYRTIVKEACPGAKAGAIDWKENDRVVPLIDMLLNGYSLADASSALDVLDLSQRIAEELIKISRLVGWEHAPISSDYCTSKELALGKPCFSNECNKCFSSAFQFNSPNGKNEMLFLLYTWGIFERINIRYFESQKGKVASVD